MTNVMLYEVTLISILDGRMPLLILLYETQQKGTKSINYSTTFFYSAAGQQAVDPC